MAEEKAKLLDYREHIERLRAQEPTLAEQLAGFSSVEHVLTWMQRHDLCRAPVDITGQDELEYDFLIELEPGGKWLAFGVT